MSAAAGREPAFSWIVRALFLVLSVGSAALALSEPTASMGEDHLRGRSLLLLGLALTSLGMALPWRRISAGRIPPAPGKNLAFLAKLAGWSGPLLVLLAIGSGPWWLALVGLFLVVSSIALWAQQPWAAWPWYAIASGAFVMAAALLVRGLSSGEAAATGGSGSAEPGAGGFTPGLAVGPALWVLLGVLLVLEIRVWQRKLPEGRDASR